MVERQSSISQVAQWLVRDVGEGGIFTKQQLRNALPQFEQIDRRMRDLRDFEWRIDTYREDAQLSPGELRLVRVGKSPEDPAARSSRVPRHTVEERKELFRSANFECQICGLALGERVDGGRPTHLKIIRVLDRSLVVCESCSRSGRSTVADAAEQFRQRLSRLTAEELEQVASRLESGRAATTVEAAVVYASRLPVEIARDCVQDSRRGRQASLAPDQPSPDASGQA